MQRRTVAAAISLAAILGLIAIRGASSQSPPARADYLTPELRAKVEKLKRDAAKPTDASNAVERGKILWDWMNAYSLTGGAIPVMATQQLLAVFPLAAGDREADSLGTARALPRNIDLLIQEFRLKDEKPHALPTITLSPQGPFPATSHQTIEQKLVIGEMQLGAGAVILCGRQIMSDSGAYQNRNPSAENYLTIKTSRAGVRFEPVELPFGGVHGGFRGAANVPAFKIASGTIQRGDTVTITYGDRSGGSPGLRMQTSANDHVLLPVYLDPEGKGAYLTPVWPWISVSGSTATGLRVTVPSIVKVGEPFEAAIRLHDTWLNRASGTAPALELRRNGQPVKTIPAGGAALQTVPNLTIDTPGTHRFEAVSADGKLRVESNPMWVEENPARRIYWGETHTHTGMAEGQGSVDGSYRYGRDDARLDFEALSEHDVALDDGEWRDMEQAVKRYAEPGRFIAFLAYEWTAQRAMGGHHNVLFRSPNRKRISMPQFWDLSRLYQGLRNAYDTKDVLVIPHAHTAADWRRSDPALERVVEIMSMHGTFEWFGNYYLRNGSQVGFLAAADDHRTRPGLSGSTASTLQGLGGLAAVMGGEKTAPAIFDAIKNRLTYAVTSADRILLDVKVNGGAMGSRTAAAPKRKVECRISGSSPIDRVDVVRNGEVVYTRLFAGGVVGSSVRAQIGFESDSEPYSRDNPRGYRTWRGTVEVQGAALKSFRLASFDNPFIDIVRLDPNNPNKLQVSIATRGRADLLELDLEGVTSSTTIVADMQGGEESNMSPGALRAVAKYPAAKIRLPFSGLKDGLLVEPIDVKPYHDKVWLQVVDPQAPKDRNFTFVDEASGTPGDYYYVRVSQLNGSRAWSSPIWVRGEAPR